MNFQEAKSLQTGTYRSDPTTTMGQCLKNRCKFSRRLSRDPIATMGRTEHVHTQTPLVCGVVVSKFIAVYRQSINDHKLRSSGYTGTATRHSPPRAI